MYYYPNATDADFSKIFIGGTGTFIMLAYWAICIVGSWKMYEKAGHAGWKSLIPFYRQYILFDIVYPDHGWKFLLMLIPIVNIVIGIILYIDLAKAYDMPGVFAVGLILLNPIFVCILGFGDAKYKYEQRG